MAKAKSRLKPRHLIITFSGGQMKLEPNDLISFLFTWLQFRNQWALNEVTELSSTLVGSGKGQHLRQTRTCEEIPVRHQPLATQAKCRNSSGSSTNIFYHAPDLGKYLAGYSVCHFTYKVSLREDVIIAITQ